MRRLASVLHDAKSGLFASAVDREWLLDWLRAGAAENRMRVWKTELARLEEFGVDVIACTDPRFPANLLALRRLGDEKLRDVPPVLFVRGKLLPSDDLAVSVVGKRDPDPAHLRRARVITSGLAERGFTIVSGLAKGIDEQAHNAALEAGGRTIAVFGTPINKVYPALHRGLARRIASSGACVSQFLPTTRPGRWAFPVRNITTSGLSLGTFVVAAEERSGALIQAKAALKQDRRVFLVRDLVKGQPWATEMMKNPLVTVVRDSSEIVDAANRAVLTSWQVTTSWTSQVHLETGLIAVPAVQRGVCASCRTAVTPSDEECYRCSPRRNARQRWSVLPISLSENSGPLHYHLRCYKDGPIENREELTQRLAELLETFLRHHLESCLGSTVDRVATVPSQKRDAPWQIVARVPRFRGYRNMLRWGTQPDGSEGPVADPEVGGKRVLLIDDTLTRGDTIFRAAEALYAANATVVGPLVIGRYIRQWYDHSQDYNGIELLSRLRDIPWDPKKCGLCAGVKFNPPLQGRQ